MKKIMYFYLSDCPYCKNAQRAMEELKRKNPDFGNIDIEWIEESEHTEMVGQYDYYYVPTMYVDGKKIYEARPGESYAECKSNVNRVLTLAAGKNN